MTDGTGHVLQSTEFMSFVLKNIWALFLLSNEAKFEKLERNGGKEEGREDGGKNKGRGPETGGRRRKDKEKGRQGGRKE